MITLERIEEIKLENEELIKRLKTVEIPSLIRKTGQISELLAALKESQQQLAKYDSMLEESINTIARIEKKLQTLMAGESK